MPEVTQAPQSTLDYSEQEQIRREKLQSMMAEGNNPYLITRYDVTHDSKAAMRNLHVFRIGGMNRNQLAAIQKTCKQLPDKKALGVIQPY